MRVKDKILMDGSKLLTEGPINIVAFGDSITYGSLRANEVDFDTVYWNVLRNKLMKVRNVVPINVINAGIGGTTAKQGLERMARQVLVHMPDLIIVSFGLNDVTGTLDDYLIPLGIIFKKAKESGADVIFMTPNMLNTYVANDTDPKFLNYAARTAEIQNSGKMDNFMESACTLAAEKGVQICDCYSAWKKKSETEDTTMLLANRINHPLRKMHNLFADSLYDVIFS